MSITVTQPSDEVRDRSDPREVFAEEIFEAHAICSNCFARVRDGGRPLPDTRGHEKVPHDPVPTYHDTDREAYGVIASYPEALFCPHCGSEAGRASDETLSKREAIANAERLADRLLELGEPIDTRDVTYAVEKLKSKPQLRGFDTEIFERATAVAIRRGRRSP